MAVLGIKAAFSALKGGEIVMITHPVPDKVDRDVIYALHPSGRQMGKRAIAVIRPMLEPMGDGLFGDEISQTFTLPRSAELQGGGK